MNAPFRLTLDRNESLRLLAGHFDTRQADKFTAPHNIESLRLDEFNQAVLSGTIFTEVAAVVQSMRHKTPQTFGELSSMLGLTQYDAHTVGCSCNGEVVMGAEVAQRLRSLMT